VLTAREAFVIGLFLGLIVGAAGGVAGAFLAR